MKNKKEVLDNIRAEHDQPPYKPFEMDGFIPPHKAGIDNFRESLTDGTLTEILAVDHNQGLMYFITRDGDSEAFGLDLATTELYREASFDQLKDMLKKRITL